MNLNIINITIYSKQNIPQNFIIFINFLFFKPCYCHFQKAINGCNKNDSMSQHDSIHAKLPPCFAIYIAGIEANGMSTGACEAYVETYGNIAKVDISYVIGYHVWCAVVQYIYRAVQGLRMKKVLFFCKFPQLNKSAGRGNYSAQRDADSHTIGQIDGSACGCNSIHEPAFIPYHRSYRISRRDMEQKTDLRRFLLNLLYLTERSQYFFSTVG